MVNISKIYPFFDAEDEFAKSFGQMIIDFCGIQNIITGFIVRLIANSDPRFAHVAVNELNFNRQLNVLMSLYELRVTERDKIENLRVLLDKLDVIEKNRNDYIHSFYSDSLFLPSENPAKGTIRRFKQSASMKKGYKIRHSDLKPSELNELSLRIRSLGVALQEIEKKYFNIIY